MSGGFQGIQNALIEHAWCALIKAKLEELTWPRVLPGLSKKMNGSCLITVHLNVPAEFVFLTPCVKSTESPGRCTFSVYQRRKIVINTSVFHIWPPT